MRVVRWIGYAALGLVLTGAARAENIKIGIMVPYSGANADLGAVQDKAFDLYMKLHAKDIAPRSSSSSAMKVLRPERTQRRWQPNSSRATR